MENKTPDQEIKIENSFAKKLDNFWYYHKWKVIIGIFVAFVFGICTYSCITRPQTDVTLVYAGPLNSTDQKIPQITDEISSVMPESVGTNGAALLVLSIYEDEDYSHITADSYKNLGNYLAMGNYSIYMLDPEVYEYYKDKQEIFVLLSDVFGDDIPESAYSEDAIKLSETELYKNNPDGIGKLPKDTLICLRVEPLIGGCQGSSNDYQKSVEMFREIAK